MNKFKKRSSDLRELIITGRNNGESYGKISMKFSISKQDSMKIVKKFQSTSVVEN